jgi:rhodanese-related sulfurtransferase
MSNDPNFVEQTELRERLRGSEKLVLIDVRSTEEFHSGHIEGAVNIPASELIARSGELSKDAAIITVCNLGGARSCGAAQQLQDLGYRALPLRGGVRGWRGSGAG